MQEVQHAILIHDFKSLKTHLVNDKYRVLKGIAFACRYSSDSVVRFLLENRADANFKENAKDPSCLVHAMDCLNGSVCKVELLLKAGADVHGTRYAMTKPIGRALMMTNTDCAKLLLYAGAKLTTAGIHTTRSVCNQTHLFHSFKIFKTLAAHTYVALLRGWRWPRDLARLMVRVLWEVRFEFSE